MPTAPVTETGSIEIPADLRQRLGLKEGDEVVLEEREGGIFLRPAAEQELWTPEETAGFLLNNAITKESYDEACEEVRKLGLDPAKVPYTDPDVRKTLPTNGEFAADFAAFERRGKEREHNHA